jgi:hypothetical protein
VAFSSLEEAQADSAGVVILQGDDGGQIYVVCPAARVVWGTEELDQLLRDIDELEWPGNDPDMARIIYERAAIGSGVAGGMGGGVVSDGPWIHSRLRDSGLVSEIESVLAGRKPRISVPPSLA